ncbi:hypothetical protein AVEN_163731-1 [Araneus ventricosus]|uniref:Tc1-like transposase DDE domain-containing protein n=1 Tax=Araneus ventricosus TaxID=182803 RepID=A0A4Y2TSE6_ARAVE|nr:hypothetical protein AVEN_163731-1 [Araneus ventricosus]
MLKIEGVKCKFVWFATPKIVTRHNAEEKRKRHTPVLPLSWHSVSVRDYNTKGPRSSVQQYIRDTFQQQVIGYGGCVEWPPRSLDMNPLDFFLWGYIKQRVYATLRQQFRNFETVLRMLAPACHLPCCTMCSGKCSTVSRCVLFLKDTILSMTDR